MPRASTIASPTSAVKRIWPRPAISATRPVVRIRRRSSFRPTTNSSSAMPSSASSSISSSAVTISSADGPARMPTAMNATISGWRKRSATAPMNAATSSSAAIS